MPVLRLTKQTWRRRTGSFKVSYFPAEYAHLSSKSVYSKTVLYSALHSLLSAIHWPMWLLCRMFKVCFTLSLNRHSKFHIPTKAPKTCTTHPELNYGAKKFETHLLRLWHHPQLKSLDCATSEHSMHDCAIIQSEMQGYIHRHTSNCV